MSDYPMRPRCEIQRAHDLLLSIALDDKLRRALFEPGALQIVTANLDALCWVLHHDHNRTLSLNLKLLEVKLAALGVELVDLGEMQYPDLTKPGVETE